jgi:hypothetical protein
LLPLNLTPGCDHPQPPEIAQAFPEGALNYKAQLTRNTGLAELRVRVLTLKNTAPTFTKPQIFWFSEIRGNSGKGQDRKCGDPFI